jgi:hypothetical protein
MDALDVVVWALLGSAVAALIDFERLATRPRRRPLLRVARIVLVGTLSGVAMSSLLVSAHHAWPTALFPEANRWAVAFLIAAAGSHRARAGRSTRLRALASRIRTTR